MASVLVFKILLVLFCLCGSAVGSRVKLFEAKKSSSAASDDGVCNTVVNPQGYVCEEHTVTTQDGYILSMQHIPNGRSGGSTGSKPPVLLQHGLLMDAITWLLSPPDQSLALLLADNGFDVWLTSTRGTKYSQGHTSLSTNDAAYWNWSWDELVAYDLPATFQYVNDQTGQKLHYVGHSLGTLTALSAFSKGQLVSMLRSAALLSPIAYVGQVTSPLATNAADDFLAEALKWLGINEFNPRGDAVLKLLKAICAKPGVDCTDLLTSFTGQNCCLNSSVVDFFLTHEPQPTSTKNMVHVAQMIRDGTIHMYDYGNADDNNQHYGQPTPPAYDMSSIPNDLPLFFANGGADALSDVNDVQLLHDDLKDHDADKMTFLYQDDYAHADYVMAVNAKQVVTSTNALYGSSSPVLQLSPNNFKSKVLNSNGVVLVEFFAPWCGHCKALTPIWEKAATVLKGVATVAALDADAHKSLAQEYGIQGFPTIKVFLPGKPPVDYQGARDAKSIANFASKQVKILLKERLDGKETGKSRDKSSEKSAPSASVELNSINFDKLVLKSKDLWVVEFFAPWCGHCKKLAPEWKKASNNLKGKVKLGHVDCEADKSLMSRFNVEGFPTILVFGADKERPSRYEGARSASAIESFALEQLEINMLPPEVTELTSQDVMEEKCGSAAISFVAFLPDILDSKAEGRNKYLELLLSVAEKFKTKPYSYVWAAAGKQPELEKQVGVGGYGYPALVALNLKKGAYAPLRSAFEREQIIDFIREAGLGGKGNLALVTTPEIVKTEPWDGKDGQFLEEDEFSLEELMGEDSKESKDEL
ncbi:hypothetical protein POM88_052013 [Heracleum sosnowskyi]|uniref:protein disulfide-isomerase n=1 Tax=Heracleum sosnowskyi TaxID=360622 RepID=A0AAD8GSB6_9APIA|nr:hypothetical protein POM88_052013 [Heracleum sosnowskyi]